MSGVNPKTTENLFHQCFLELCASGWVFHAYSGKCYRHISAKMDWNDALESCKSANINRKISLASIPDSITNKFLTTLTQERAWTGGFKKSDGTWAWSDGAQWGYTNWASGRVAAHSNWKNHQIQLSI